jgi:hypothetical protein
LSSAKLKELFFFSLSDGAQREVGGPQTEKKTENRTQRTAGGEKKNLKEEKQSKSKQRLGKILGMVGKDSRDGWGGFSEWLGKILGIGGKDSRNWRERFSELVGKSVGMAGKEYRDGWGRFLGRPGKILGVIQLGNLKVLEAVRKGSRGVWGRFSERVEKEKKGVKKRDAHSQNERSPWQPCEAETWAAQAKERGKKKKEDNSHSDALRGRGGGGAVAPTRFVGELKP